MELKDQIELACLMEATARKPGNVHCAAGFDDLQYDDFVRAAAATAAPIAQVRRVGLGTSILSAVQASRDMTGTNVNLGIVLLLAPLAAVPAALSLTQGISQVLEQTTVADAEQVYTAIAVAQPGGLGRATTQDVRDRPTVTLRDAMALASERDQIARQYVTNFADVVEARDQWRNYLAAGDDWETATVRLQIWMLAHWPDSLIRRKCGSAVAEEASRRARAVWQDLPQAPAFRRESLADFDRWLRADGHRRNPGTTADLIAAAIFASLRDGLINVPAKHEILKFAETHRQPRRDDHGH